MVNMLRSRGVIKIKKNNGRNLTIINIFAKLL
jgi:hypothetical protein